MCGIWGLYRVGGCHDASWLIEQMQLAKVRLSHRGPDSTQQKIISTSRSSLALLQTRLAIVDPNYGSPELFHFENTADKSTTILVCNGEIYNHVSLRQGLLSYPFQSNCDSEVILASYQAYGIEQTLHLLDGMFAFLIVGINAQGKVIDIICARDPLGIKPLFVSTSQAYVICASEMKAIPTVSNLKLREVPAGTYLRWQPTSRSIGPVEVHRYFRPDWDPPTTVSLENEFYPAIRMRLARAVEKRLMGTSEVGVFLSGGLDSSLIAAIAAKKSRRQRLKTFTIYHTADSESSNSDRMMAQYVSAAINSEHYEYSFTSDEAQAALPHVIYQMETYDRPSVRAGIALYLLSKKIRQHHRLMKVVLCGEGADELFAGYSLFRRYTHSQQSNAFQYEMTRRLVHIGSSELLRVDRCTMAFGLEARVPFLDLDFIHVAMNIPPMFKRHSIHIEKHILRRAFDGILPPLVLMRRKVEFAQGMSNQDWFPNPYEEAHTYNHHFRVAFPSTEVHACVRQRHALRRHSFEPVPLILTPDQVITFLHLRLHLRMTTLPPPTIEVLQMVVNAMHQHIPFQNLTLLTRPKRPPTWAEIVQDMMGGLGGPCAVINAFLFALLDTMGFEVTFRAATIAKRIDCHICLVCHLEKRLWFVDCGNAKPYAPCALDDDSINYVSSMDFSWRLVRIGEIIYVQHASISNRSQWHSTMTFDAVRAVPYVYFRSSIRQSRTDPLYGPFLKGLRLVRYPGMQLCAIRDRFMQSPDQPGSMAMTSSELVVFVMSHFGDVPGILPLFHASLDCLALFGTGDDVKRMSDSSVNSILLSTFPSNME